MILTHHTDVRVARIVLFNAAGVCYGAHHLRFYHVGGVAEVYGVAQALAHLGVAVQSHQPGTIGKHDIRLHQRFAVQLVKAADDLAGHFHVRLLILAYRHQVRLTEGDIRRLADGIPQKAVGHIAVAVVGRLGLDGGVVPQRINRHQHGIKDGQLPDGRDAALLYQRNLVGVQPDRQVIHRYLVDAVLQQLRVFKVGGQRLDIRQQDKTLVFLLQLDAALQAAHIVAQMQLAGGTVPGQDSFLLWHGQRSPLQWFLLPFIIAGKGAFCNGRFAFRPLPAKNTARRAGFL